MVMMRIVTQSAAAKLLLQCFVSFRLMKEAFIVGLLLR